MSEEVGIEEARKNLGDIANRAHYAGQVTYITRRGQRIAAIVPANRAAQEKPMTRQDLTAAVRTTLGDHPGSFNVDGIVEEIGATYGWDLASIDDVPSDEYWAIVERHDSEVSS